MASETSAVFVAVRVRPFASAEDPMECVVTVPAEKLVSLTDLSTGSMHNYTFDRVFWSVPSDVLPMRPTAELISRFGSLGSGSSGSTLSTSRSMSGLTTASGVRASFAGSPTSTPRLFPSESMDGISRNTSIHRKSRRNSCGASIHPNSSNSTSAPANGSNGTMSIEKLPCLMPTREYEDQAAVYDFMGPRLYESAMAGFNSCLFAYGQTGSGKTHSMMGPPLRGNTNNNKDPGIMPRLCQDLFRLMKKERDDDEGVSYNVECSFMEIYCEKVRDLLPQSHSVVAAVAAAAAAEESEKVSSEPVPHARRKSEATPSGGASSGAGGTTLRIRQHPTRGPYVESLSMVRVRDAEGAMKLMTHGLRERATAETKMNEHSSRSHAIFQLHITKVMVVRDETGVITKTRTCKVNMVDLAGSERINQSGAVGERFEEARNINLSLSTLGRVIQQLSEKQAGKHVIPAYRDSSLTWLLSDSIGGNSKTMMLATIAPSAYCYQQTLNTLRFAGVAKKVINVATINEDKHFQKLVADLREQIVKLTLQLEEGKPSDVHTEEIEFLRQEKEELESRNELLRAKLASSTPQVEVEALRKRIRQLESENATVHAERTELQRLMTSSVGSLREELAQKRGEVLGLRESMAAKDEEMREMVRKHKEEILRRSQAAAAAAAAAAPATANGQSGKRFSTTSDLGSEGSGPASLLQSTTSMAQNAAAALQLRNTKEALAKAEKYVAELKHDLEVERQRRTDADRAKGTMTAQLDVSKKETRTLRQQVEELHAKVASTSLSLGSVERDLRGTKEQLALMKSGVSPTDKEKSLIAQVEKAREDYLQEKQSSVDLLVRVAHLERQVMHLKKSLKGKRADVDEVEQLLLEETETSERYYLRIRFMRNLSDVQRNFARDMSQAYQRGILDLVNENLEREKWRQEELEEMREKQQQQSAQLPTTLTETPIRPTGSSPGAMARLDSNEQIAFLTRNELELQECIMDEAYSRAILEQSYLETFVEYMGQFGFLTQCHTEHLQDVVHQMRAEARHQTGEIELLEQRVHTLLATAESRDSEEDRLRRTLMDSQAAREKLERQVNTLSEKVERELRSNETLVRKVAEAQTEMGDLKARCEEAELLAAKTQEALLSGESEAVKRFKRLLGVQSDTPASRDEDDDDSSNGSRFSVGHREHGSLNTTQAPRHNMGANLAGTITSANLAATQTMSNELHQLQQQVEEQREEVGRLNALLEKERYEKAEKTRSLQREVEQQTQQLESAVEARRRAVQENGDLAKNYQARVDQLTQAVEALQVELKQEVVITDECRTRAAKAEAERAAAQEAASRATKAKEELEASHNAMETTLSILQQTVKELREAYAQLENRLLSFSYRDPQVFVTIDRDDDDQNWLEKAEKERDDLVKQKMEARKLNEELLEHVRKRNESLRDVHRQINRLRGEMSPEQIKTRSKSRDPLYRQLGERSP